MNQQYIRRIVFIALWTAVVGLLAMPAFGQITPGGVAVQGIATELIAVARWGGVIVFVVMGLWLAIEHQHGVFGKLATVIIALIFALFPQQMVAYLQSIG